MWLLHENEAWKDRFYFVTSEGTSFRQARAGDSLYKGFLLLINPPSYIVTFVYTVRKYLVVLAILVGGEKWSLCCVDMVESSAGLMAESLSDSQSVGTSRQ